MLIGTRLTTRPADEPREYTPTCPQKLVTKAKKDDDGKRYGVLAEKANKVGSVLMPPQGEEAQIPR